MKRLNVVVEVWQYGYLMRRYVMDHNDIQQRKVLGEQCRNAFEGGQMVITYPENAA